MRKWLLVLLLALALPVRAAVVYGPAGQFGAAQQFITSKPGYWERVDKEVEKITGVAFSVRFMPCDAGQTSYGRGVITICYGLVDRFGAASAKFDRPRTITAGAVMFALLHEMGHAVIEAKGRGTMHGENDADGFAAMMARKIGAGGIVMPAIAFVSFKKGLLYGSGSGKLRDEHSLPEQRQANAVCMLAGGDGAATQWAVNQRIITPERAARCNGEAIEAEKAVNAMIQ